MREEEFAEKLTRIDVNLLYLVARDDDHETRLRALESRVLPPDERHGTQLGAHGAQLSDQEARLRGLERWRWSSSGAGGLVGGLAGVLLAKATGAAGLVPAGVITMLWGG